MWNRKGGEGSTLVTLESVICGWWKQQCVKCLGKLGIEGNSLRWPERLGHQVHGTDKLTD